MMRTRRWLIALTALFAAACAADATPAATGIPIGSPPEVTADLRIVSLSPTATEMLFAIGADDAVVAVDEFSTFPPSAPITDLSGFTPNIEALLEFDPTHVVAQYDADSMVAALEAADVEVLLQPSASSLADTYDQIVELGTLTGRTAAAAALVDDMRADIDAIIARVPVWDDPPTYYFEVGTGFYAASADTYAGALLTQLGFVNITASVDGNTFPQLTAEFVLDADPDFIFLADTICCGASAASIGALPGFDTVTAVVEGNVVELDDDIASRWGPRVVDLLEAVVGAVTADE